MKDAIIISDIHLGSDNCEAKALREFLDNINEKTHKLILNGDVFESIDFRRLKKHHWHVLSTLRRLSDQMEIVWICGNHDGPAEIVSHLLGIPVVDEYVLHSGDRQILVLHGHKFDTFLDEHPILTWIGDFVYMLLQKIDRSHHVARLAKHSSKHYLRCAEQICRRAIEYAQEKGCDTVCCGHTHHAAAVEELIDYYNSGCWTEKPCSYLEVDDGQVALKFVELL